MDKVLCLLFGQIPVMTLAYRQKRYELRFYVVFLKHSKALIFKNKLRHARFLAPQISNPILQFFPVMVHVHFYQYR